jgi:SAM-dependent methyltransferase
MPELPDQASIADSEVKRFDQLYAHSDDPWDYLISPSERAKYEHTLAAIAPRHFDCALEVGCSIGVFTAMLARRCDRVVAIDFSRRALELARPGLPANTNVELLHRSFPEEVPEGAFDLIICSEVLYYLHTQSLARAVTWLQDQLTAGACLVAVSWRGVGHDEPLRGDEVHDLLAQELKPWHVLDDRRPTYRLDRFDGHGG